MKKNKIITNNNLVTIKIVLQENNILNNFAPIEDYVLNTQIEDYILAQSEAAKLNSHYELEVIAAQQESRIFSLALKKALKRRITIAHNQIQRNKIASLLMLVVGLIILALGYMLNDYVFLYEIFLVASWVFLWRAVELSFFEARKIKLNIIKYNKLLQASIVAKTKDTVK